MQVIVDPLFSLSGALLHLSGFISQQAVVSVCTPTEKRRLELFFFSLSLCNYSRILGLNKGAFVLAAVYLSG